MNAKFLAYMPEAYADHKFTAPPCSALPAAAAAPWATSAPAMTGHPGGLRRHQGPGGGEGAQLELAAIPGKTVDQYNFYRAVAIVCDGRSC
jgi:hypothetical protein